MKQYKAAFVGYGGMGHWHYTGICLTDRVKFIGVYDINPQRMELALSEGMEKAYGSYEELLADKEVDIVVVATPNNFHCPLVCQALEAGKTVVCEKPVAMSSEELQVMTAVRSATSLSKLTWRTWSAAFLSTLSALRSILRVSIRELKALSALDRKSVV